METTPTKPNNHGILNSVRRPISQKAAVLMAVAAAMPVTATVANAQSSLVQQEIARRAKLVSDSNEELIKGRAAYAKKDYKKAHDHYSEALRLLPPSPALADRRRSYTGHLGDAAVALAQEYRRVGKYAEARALLEGLLLRDPTNFAAKKQLEYLDDPIRTNPALTFEHTKNVNTVRKHLYMGEGYYNLGQYDKADEEFKKVLQIDPYNKAARRWMEKVNNTKTDYYRAAYDHTRSQLLMEVDRAWEIAVPQELPDLGRDQRQGGPSSGVQYIQQKLNDIIIPVVQFDNSTLEEALDYLRLRARELDTEPNEDLKGINFIIRTPSVTAVGGEVDAGADALDAADAGAAPANIGGLRIDELKLRNVPLGTVLQYICDKTRLRFKLDEHSVILLPLTAVDAEDLYTRSYVVPPDFIATLESDGPGEGADDADPFGDDPDDAVALKARASAQELLQRNGVSFPPKAFANYIPATSTLVVRNTLSNLDVIESIIDAIRVKGPRQVRIMTKFVEISQENTDELGFDWVMNPTNIGTSGTFFGGGSLGNGALRNVSDFGNPNIFGGASTVDNIATGGLRSGDFAITRDSISALLNNPNRATQNTSVAPGILSFTGLFTDGQVQMIMRGLAQKKGADIMTAPSVLARSGEKATIEVIREFIYPTEYEPPELPNSVGVGTGVGGGGGIGGGGAAIFPVTPATPTAFETRNTGVTLEIEPTIGENNYTIDLRFAPEIVEFEGFINYGSPIQSPATDAAGNPIQVTITDNRIEMPVFSTRRVTTALTIYDGYTVAVGGLMREDVQNVEDKVPILGDLPLIGRLFQSKSENRIKSNLIIFVTAQIIDAAGNPVNSSTAVNPNTTPSAAAPVAPASVGGTDGAGLLPSRG